MENDPKKSIGAKVRDWTQFAVILFASVWGIYTFVYKEIIVPAHRPAALAISCDLQEVGRNENMALVRARVHLANKRDTKIYAPAIWLTLKGLRITAKEASDERIVPPAENVQPPPEKFASSSEEEASFVARWRLPDWETWYEPGDETTNEVLFYVPLNLYEAAELTVQVFVTKNIDDLASVKWNVAEDGSFEPILMLKGPGYDKDKHPELVEPFKAETTQHRKWEVKYGVGQDWSVTVLSLLRPAVEEKKPRT